MWSSNMLGCMGYLLIFLSGGQMFVAVVLLAIAVILLANRLRKIEDRFDALVDALMEDAEHDYEERIEKMFGFLTEGLDPEEDDKG